MNANLSSGKKEDNNQQRSNLKSQKSSTGVSVSFNVSSSSSSSSSTSSSSSSSSSTSTAERILANANYLNNLLSLIPAKAYFGQTDNLEREPVISSKYLKNNTKQASIEQARKEASKKGQKRTRYEADAANDHTVPGILSQQQQSQKQKTISTTSSSTITSTTVTSSSTPSTLPKSKASPYGDLDEEHNNDNNANQSKRLRTDENMNTSQRATSIEELRQRLQAKIMEKQNARESKKEKKDEGKNTSNNNTMTIKDKQKKDGKKEGQPKNDTKNNIPTTKTNPKKDTSSTSASGTVDSIQHNSSSSSQKLTKPSTSRNHPSTHPTNKPSNNKPQQQQSSQGSASNDNDFDTSAMDLAFSTISSSLPAELAVTTISTRPNLPQHGSKESTMKAMLNKAQRYQEALQRHDKEGRQDKKLEMEFDHALRRAQGEAVKDDPTLIAKAMKRHQKEKAKSTAEWNERKEKLDEEGRVRQQERKDNLANKKHRALKKSERPDEPVNKRSNDEQQSSSQGGGAGKGSGNNNNHGKGGGGGAGGKSFSSSMNRPGFEGKKKGFINA